MLAALQVQQNYVQTLVSTLPPAEAVMVVARAGMDVKDTKGPTRAALTVKPGPTSGSAHAYAHAAKPRATYEWQWAREGGPWKPVASIPRAKVTLEGLAVGTLIQVRVRPVLGKGPLDGLGPVSYRVV